MPIAIKSVVLEYKILPIELLLDGSCNVTIRKGFVDSDIFVAINSNTINIPTTDTAALLDAEPIPGLSRRNDLAYAVYTYLVATGHIEAGAIS